jgi:hypothetical protein
MFQESGSDNFTDFIFRIGWSSSGKRLAVSTDRFSGSGSAAVTILGLEKKLQEITCIDGHQGAFIDEDTILYSGVRQKGTFAYSIRSGHSHKLLPAGDWPTPFAAAKG